MGGSSKRSERKSPAPRPPAKLERRPVARRNYWPVGLGILFGAAIAGIFWSQKDTWPPSLIGFWQTVGPTSDRQTSPGDQQQEHHQGALLAFQNSRATINNPLPLGISLNSASGGETVVLSGFVEGTSLSAGTALSSIRWSVPASDLDKAFISAPQEFSGTMQVTVKLYSSAQDLLETKVVQFEWGALQKGDKLPIGSRARNPAR